MTRSGHCCGPATPTPAARATAGSHTPPALHTYTDGPHGRLPLLHVAAHTSPSVRARGYDAGSPGRLKRGEEAGRQQVMAAGGTAGDAGGARLKEGQMVTVGPWNVLHTRSAVALGAATSYSMLALHTRHGRHDRTRASHPVASQLPYGQRGQVRQEVMKVATGAPITPAEYCMPPAQPHC